MANSINQIAQNDFQNGTATPNYTLSTLDMENAGINPLALYKQSPGDDGAQQTTAQQAANEAQANANNAGAAKNIGSAAKSTIDTLGSVALLALLFM